MTIAQYVVKPVTPNPLKQVQKERTLRHTFITFQRPLPI